VLRPWASLVAESSEPRQRRRPKPAAAAARFAAPGPGPEASASPGTPPARRRSRRRAPAATPADAPTAARLALPRPAVGDDTPADLLLVGRVVAAQGLGGELRVQPLSDFPERFTSPGRRWLRRRGEPAQCWQLLSGRQLPGRELFVLRLATIEDRTAAEALVGADLLVAASDRPALAEGEFHLLDLVGLEVRLLPQGRPIGRVEDLIHAGQDLLEISLWGEDQPLRMEGPSAPGIGRSSRRLVPFVKAIVPEVHPDEGWLGLMPPPGLLEL
jgi:16S rRNA processing protein RimM